jgi:hypothetical protein
MKIFFIREKGQVKLKNKHITSISSYSILVMKEMIGNFRKEFLQGFPFFNKITSAAESIAIFVMLHNTDTKM